MIRSRGVPAPPVTIGNLEILDDGRVGITATPQTISGGSYSALNLPYGLQWDETNDTYQRLGFVLPAIAAGTKPPDYLLPIQGRMRRCVVNDAGVVQYYLHPNDSTKKIDGTAANLDGTDGQVMVEIPKFWYRYNYVAPFHNWEISPVEVEGFSVHPAFTKDGSEVAYRYMGAYEGVLYDTSAGIYANAIYQGSKSFSFAAATKTITKLSGSVATVNMTGAAAGTGYAVGNVLTLAGGTLSPTVTVATIGAGGEVLSVTLTTKGYGNTTGVKATSGGTGLGCTVNLATLETLTNPFSNLATGDKVTVSGSGSNNGTFTVATVTDGAITVSEAVVDETYALTASIVTQKDFTATTGDKLSSIAGKAPVTYGTRAQFRAMAKNRGTGWRQLDFDLHSAIQLLYLIEYGSFYSQSVLGAGITAVSGWDVYNDYNPIAKTGNSTTNASGNTAGSTSAATEKTKYLSYRGIENWYGHVWKFVDGININSNVPYVSNNATQWADDTASNYTDLGITLHNVDGYQATVEQVGRGFFPASVGASSSTKITDYYYQASGWRVVISGGKAVDGGLAGAFDLLSIGGSGAAYRDVGGRLCF